MELFYVLAFGLFGILFRYIISQQFHNIFKFNFPLDIFFINLLGSIFIGLFYVISSEKFLLSNNIKIGVMVGFLGGFTTFSSYCLDAVKLFENQHYFQSILYIILSPIIGISLTYLSIFIARKFV
ncbi:fluoride efflux transporter CrcB [Spirobacillus cienkowskii]|jgi:CrcB protein